MIEKYGFRMLVPLNYNLWFCEKYNKWYLFDRIPPDVDNWQDWYLVHSLKAAKDTSENIWKFRQVQSLL